MLKDSTVVFGKYLSPSALAALAVALAPLAVGNPAWAQRTNPFVLSETIPVPPTGSNNTASGLYSWDISWVDRSTHRYYLADRSNNTVDIVDTTSNTLILQLDIGGFAGFAANPGPNGVATSGPCLFVTDAPSRVASYITTPFPPTFVNDVHTDPSDPTRADELAVDPLHALILAINNASSPPFGTFIKYNPATCKLTAPASPGVDRVTFTTATNGAEQLVWDPVTGKFYLSIPSISGTLVNPGPIGAVFRIDPNTKMVDFTYPVTFCMPAGLTKGPGNDVLIGCNTVYDTGGNTWTATDPDIAAPIQVILNVMTGDQFRVGGVGASDEVWFNNSDGNYYTGSQRSPLAAVTNGGGTVLASSAAILGVIDATAGQLLQLVPTYNAVAVTTGPLASRHPAGTAHSVAADAEPTQVFVPLAANNVYPDCTQGCIAVYAPGNSNQPVEVVLPPP